MVKVVNTWTANTITMQTTAGMRLINRWKRKEVHQYMLNVIPATRNWLRAFICNNYKKYKNLYYHLNVKEREIFYLTTHSTHFIYGYMASDIWLRTILIVRKETRCHHIGYSYRLTARVLLYAPSHRQDNTYHGLCYTSRGALAGMRNSSMGPPQRTLYLWATSCSLKCKNITYIARSV